MEEVKEFKNLVFDTTNNGFISIPYCNYVTGNIDIENNNFLDNLETMNQNNNIIIKVQDISSVHITRTLKYYNGWNYWMVFSLRNGHVVFSRVENNNEAKKMEGIVRKYISDLFRCQIKKED